MIHIGTIYVFLLVQGFLFKKCQEAKKYLNCLYDHLILHHYPEYFETYQMHDGYNLMILAYMMYPFTLIYMVQLFRLTDEWKIRWGISFQNDSYSILAQPLLLLGLP